MNEYVSVSTKKGIGRCRQNKTLVTQGDGEGRANCSGRMGKILAFPLCNFSTF